MRLVLLCGHLSLFSPDPVVTSYNNGFNVHKSSILPTQCVYVFCVVLGTNSDYIRVQRQFMSGFYSPDEVFTAGMTIADFPFKGLMGLILKINGNSTEGWH
jgi:hypothetical protein